MYNMPHVSVSDLRQLRCEAAPAMMPQHRNGPDVGAQYAGLLVNLHHDIPDDAAARVSRDVLELRPCEDGVTELLHRVSILLGEASGCILVFGRDHLCWPCQWQPLLVWGDRLQQSWGERSVVLPK
ncbi:hypothetical protein NL676_019373 [Syzygium grande]|nr:hypothetical protein NL676_019373 [Syzygium grande]